MYWHGRGEGEIDNDNEGEGGVALIGTTKSLFSGIFGYLLQITLVSYAVRP